MGRRRSGCSTIKDFYAAGGEDTTRSEAFQIDAGDPAILLGTDTGANPAEFLLHALAACLTTSIVCVAAARKVQLNTVESTLTGDIDVRGALGVDDQPRNGFERIGVSFRVTGQRAGGKAPRGRRASPEALRRLRHGHQRRARRRRVGSPSAVTNATPVANLPSASRNERASCAGAGLARAAIVISVQRRFFAELTMRPTSQVW